MPFEEDGVNNQTLEEMRLVRLFFVQLRFGFLLFVVNFGAEELCIIVPISSIFCRWRALWYFAHDYSSPCVNV